MVEKINNVGSGFGFVNLVTGITTVIVVFFAFILMKYGASISLSEIIKEVSDISFFDLIIYVVSFVIGFFVHGMRYLGFDYYRRLYNKNKQKEKDEQRKIKKQKKSLFMRILFYLFRNGTIIEECLNEKRCPEKTFDWIRNSDKPAVDVWNYARKISLESPKADIYQFYYHSEVFQCFDTVFFMLSFVAFCFGAWGIGMNYKNLESRHFSVLVFSLILFFLHWLCKKTSKSFARRFFLEIQTNLNVINGNVDGKK
ncbi:MAG: hypothetical protein J6K96_10240 [Treponema sp.]|nr:hypothetical protein [Treponema sp.]